MRQSIPKPKGFTIVQLRDGAYEVAKRSRSGWNVFDLHDDPNTVRYLRVLPSGIHTHGIRFDGLDDETKLRINTLFAILNKRPKRKLQVWGQVKPPKKSNYNTIKVAMLCAYERCMGKVNPTKRGIFTERLNSALAKGLGKGGMLRKRDSVTKCLGLLERWKESEDKQFLKNRLAALLLSNFAYLAQKTKVA